MNRNGGAERRRSISVDALSENENGEPVHAVARRRVQGKHGSEEERNDPTLEPSSPVRPSRSEAHLRASCVLHDLPLLSAWPCTSHYPLLERRETCSATAVLTVRSPPQHRLACAAGRAPPFQHGSALLPRAHPLRAPLPRYPLHARGVRAARAGVRSPDSRDAVEVHQAPRVIENRNESYESAFASRRPSRYAPSLLPDWRAARASFWVLNMALR